MNDHVCKLTELAGTSTSSMEDASCKAIQCAYESVKSLKMGREFTGSDFTSGAEPFI